MTTMIAEIYEALIEAGASEARSRAAAEALSAYDGRFVAIDRRFDALERHIDSLKGGLEFRLESVRAGLDAKIGALKAGLDVKIERLDGRCSMMQWQLALLMGGVVTLIIRACFSPH